MKDIIIPVANSGFHKGHKWLVEYAKLLGNPVIQLVPSSALQYYSYTRNVSLPYYSERYIDEFYNLGREMKVETCVRPFYEFPSDESDRLDILKKSRKLAELYRTLLLFDSNVERAVVYLMVFFASLQSLDRDYSVADSGLILRGPEILTFFFKSISELYGIHTYVFPAVIKHESTKIRYQSQHRKLGKEAKKEFANFRKVVDDYKSRLRIGANNDIVKEVNYSYKERLWEILEIGVWEGGLVQGRLEVTKFMLPLDAKLGTPEFEISDSTDSRLVNSTNPYPLGGTVLLEEIDYYV